MKVQIRMLKLKRKEKERDTRKRRKSLKILLMLLYSSKYKMRSSLMKKEKRPLGVLPQIRKNSSVKVMMISKKT